MTPDKKRLKQRETFLQTKYGISVEEYNAMLEAQDGVCAGCGRRPEGKHLDVDHCHKAGIIRGLLCNPCNMALAKVKDDPDVLMQLRDYLLDRSRYHGRVVPSGNERSFVRRLDNHYVHEKELKKFLYGDWNTRDETPLEPDPDARENWS